MSAGVVIVDAATGPSLDIVQEGGSARAVIWPGMGAELRSLHMIALEPTGRTKRSEHSSEAVYYVISGSGEVRERADMPGEQLIPGSMVHVEPATPYVFTAGEEGMELVGGPSPADPDIYPSGS